jgi:UDP-N-acetylmuramate dehydrogenase
MSTETYYAIGGQAEFYAEPKSVSQIFECLDWAQRSALPIAVFGSGSNSLLADGTFKGLVIALSGLTNAYWEKDDLLFAEAGVSNTEIAEICLDAGRNGAGWMYRMPGQLGASVRMNARCYGGEISQIVHEVFTIDVHGRLRIHAAQDVFHGYKKTLLMDSPEIVLAARLKFPAAADRSEILSFMQNCESDRHRKHHFDYPSCGSTFKNNYQVGRPSGQIFDECGLKGTRIGQSEVSQFHANFVWNLGGASAHDMLSLAAHMREQARTLKNADLELEVQPVGCFEKALFDACAMERLGPWIENSESATDARWVGLLWHPHSRTAAEPTQEPRVLLHAPFQHYFRTPGVGCPQLSVQLLQLMSLSDARAHPNKAFLRWDTLQDPEKLHPQDRLSSLKVTQPSTLSSSLWSDLFPLIPESPADFLDELWSYSVSELFVAHGNPESDEYYEFEMTPRGHWVALAFDAPRQRKPAHYIPKKTLWPCPDMQSDDHRFSFGLSYALLEPLIFQGSLRIQACLSLGHEGWYLAPHWAPSSSSECWDTQDKPDVKPDFHQPRRFWRVALI